MSRFAAVAALLLVPSLALAGKVKTYTASAPSHYDKAQVQNAVVTSDGTVRLARSLKPLPGALDATRIWDVAEDKAGNLYVATGDDGKIFKITSDGKTSVAFNSEDSQVLCLTVAADGTVFAGTGPNGTVVRIDATGNAAVFATSTEKYIWSLTYDDKTKTLYAATGPRGKILAVDPQGKSTVFFQAKQDHILCLARAEDGTLYAGTDKQGLIYRIDAKGKGFVLFQAPQAEVRCLYLTATALYAGTSAASGSRGGSSGGTPSGSVSAIPGLGGDASRVSEDGKTKAASASSREKGSDGDKSASATPAAPPTAGENSVYRIGFDGSVRELFREKGLVLSLYPHAGRLFVGTGLKGQLFEINESTKERSEVSRLDHGQVQRLFARRDGTLIVAGSDPARLYSLSDRFAAKGTVVSEVIDAKLASKWGALSWQADLPKGAAVSVAVRAGNVADPDDTWTDWSAELTDPKESPAPVPAARYLQYRVTLTADDTGVSPALHNLTIRYATLNQAPEVTALDVPNADAVRESKKLRVKWSATDANEDELAFDLYVRKDSWKDWIRIEEGLSKTEYEWDTTTMPSGVYRIKVVASDRPDNNEESALTGERVSLPVAVAHEPPAVTVKLTGVENGRATFEAAATAELVRLSSATYAINSGKWTSVFPTDGVFDAKAEKFRFQSEPLRPGSYVLVLKVRDAAGNVGSADVVFAVK